MLQNMIKVPKSVIGIDCSTKSFGYGRFTNGEFTECGQVFFPGDNLWQRLNSAHQMVPPLVSMGLLEADLIVFERAVVVGNNYDTALSLAYVYGAVIGALMASDARVAKVPPLTWQSYIGNPNLTTAEKARIKADNPGKSKSWYSTKSREVRKQKTMDWARQYASIETGSDDVSDAIGLAWYGVNNHFKLEYDR